MEKRTKRRRINICSWNVDGLRTKDFNKFEDCSFTSHIKLYDIIGLVETHNNSSLSSPLPNYKIYHTYRTQNTRAKRLFGGISVLVRKSISAGVTPLPVTNSNFMWFKLCKSFFTLYKDLYICFLHIPPENSTYSIKEGDQFETLKRYS